MKILLLFLLFGSVSQSNSEAQNCNGRSKYCELRFNQITLPGSHAAGSGFNGSVRNCQGGISSQSNCIFRNQNLSITDQLDLGIRFLGLDICILPMTCDIYEFGDLNTSRLVSCQGSLSGSTQGGYRYGGTIIHIFQQVDKWMRVNSNEIISLYFTNNIPAEDLPLAGQMIADILEQRWGEGAATTKMSTYFTSNGNIWPTLRYAVETNERIFVLFDQELVLGPLASKPWLHPPPYTTMEPSTWNGACPIRGAEEQLICKDTNKSDIVILNAFNLEICLPFAQMTCNSLILNASTTCFNFLRMDGKTLNVVLVDFVQLDKTVYEVVLELNRKNVGDFIAGSNGGTSGTTLSPGSTAIPQGTVITTQETASGAAATLMCSSHHWVWFLVCAALYCVF